MSQTQFHIPSHELPNAFLPFLTATQDLTFFFEPTQAKRWFEYCLPNQNALRNPNVPVAKLNALKAFDEQITFDALSGRLCMCSCFCGQRLSATLRLDKGCFKAQSWNPAALKEWQYEKTRDFPVQTTHIVETIWDLLGFKQLPRSPRTDGSRGAAASATKAFQAIVPPTGVVVFSGSTNSAKTKVAQPFCLSAIWRALERVIALRKRHPIRSKNQVPGDRLPHLVTFEDPIEKWFVYTRQGKDIPLTLAEHTADLGFCLTARQASRDVRSLEQALLDARRQTPSCVFIGEVRHNSEWEAILDFAGTGHLVVATTHAANLSETLSRILGATRANTPTRRREVAAQLLACVHMVKVPLKTGEMAVLPSIWTREHGGLSALVSEGLSSLTRNNKSVLGRRQFLHALAKGGKANSKSFTLALGAATAYDVKRICQS